jgi:hypothetical protein
MKQFTLVKNFGLRGATYSLVRYWLEHAVNYKESIRTLGNKDGILALPTAFHGPHRFIWDFHYEIVAKDILVDIERRRKAEIGEIYWSGYRKAEMFFDTLQHLSFEGNTHRRFFIDDENNSHFHGSTNLGKGIVCLEHGKGIEVLLPGQGFFASAEFEYQITGNSLISNHSYRLTTEEKQFPGTKVAINNLQRIPMLGDGTIPQPVLYALEDATRNADYLLDYDAEERRIRSPHDIVKDKPVVASQEIKTQEKFIDLDSVY